jgi:hypothetical protein|tara:strand:+ start:391 stop:717 length:327 start_codon:yes stop_codon:yes gene_type:complete
MFDLLFSTTGIHTVPAPLDALTEELATLQASLNAGGDEQDAARLCFDHNLVEVATRALRHVNDGISDELFRTSWYWRGENGEISAEEALQGEVIYNRAITRHVTDPLQ